MPKRGIAKLSDADRKLLTWLESHPYSALAAREQRRADKLAHSHNVIERYTLAINPAIYGYLPGTRSLYLILIDTMLVPAERRIQDYLRRSRFLERMTIYATFGEIAFVGFIVATAQEITTLAQEIFDAVHTGPGAIERNKSCDLRRGTRLYSVTNALVLCGSKLAPTSGVEPNKAHLVELSAAVADAKAFGTKNRALGVLRSHGYIGPFTVQVDPVRVGRFVVFIPLFLAEEQDLREDILADRALMAKIRHIYRVSDVPNWGDDYYQYMNFLLMCEFDGLATDYSDWYDRLIQKISRANINEFAIRARIHEAIFPISDIPRMQEVAARYGADRKSGLVLGRALVPAGPGKGPEIALSKPALAKHVLVMGLPRTGKSSTLARIASEARRLGMSVLFVDGKGDLLSHDGTVSSSTLRSLHPVIIDPSSFATSPPTTDPNGRMVLVSVKNLPREKYGVFFGDLLKYLDRMPTVSKPNQKVTQIERVVVIDEVETLVGDDVALHDTLERILTQAASKGNCFVPVLHHFPKERPRLLERCENRIVHRLQADADDVQELFVGRGRDAALLFDIEATLPTLDTGTVFVSFLDSELKRLPAMHVEIINSAQE